MNDDYDNNSNQFHDDDSQDNSTVASASLIDEDNGYQPSNSRKRKRGQDSLLDQQHVLYADQLLDYFITSASDNSKMWEDPPVPPEPFQVDRPIDDQAHTALHWAAAMGDIDVVRFCLERGASPFARNRRGETPLIRAVLFTNNYEKDTMLKLVHQLVVSVQEHDMHKGTVLHHIAMTTNSRAKKRCARYYVDIVLNKMAETFTPQEFTRFVNLQDANGDTALHIVARHEARKCIRALQGRGVRGDIHNHRGETADHILQSQHPLHHDIASSSPLGPDLNALNGHEIVKVPKPGPASHYHSQSARSFSQSFGPIAQDKSLQVALAFDSEIRDKDDDLQEGQRLHQQVEKERHQVRQATFRHLTDQTDTYDEEEFQRMRVEEEKLQAEIESLSEQIQHRELHHAVRSEEHNLPPSAHRKNSTSAIVLDENDLDDRYRAGIALAVEQSKRRKLTTDVAEAQGSAGMSLHGEALKRLVSVTCGVPADEVPVLAPELLDELQQSKIDVGNEVVALA